MFVLSNTLPFFFFVYTILYIPVFTSITTGAPSPTGLVSGHEALVLGSRR